MSAINQKEYLKKYLGIGKAPGEKKKKKKKEKAVGNRLKIIDDDIDVLISREIEDDLAAANEYAPQIVAVIDERPHSLQVDEKTNSSLWQPLGEPSRIDTDSQTLKVNSFKLGKQETHKSTSKVTKKSVSESYSRSKKSILIETKTEHESYSEPYSRKNNSEDDYSPPRKSIRENSSVSSDKDNDYSPPRRRNNNADNSPLRKRIEEDSSPRRRNREDNSPPRRRKNEYSREKGTENYDSPPRRKNNSADNSPVRKRIEEDSSPRRRDREDNSPPRRRKDEYSREKGTEDDHSPPRKKHRNESRSRSENIDLSPSRKSKREGKKSRWSPEKSPESSITEKMKKTLDGKRAGLQNAKDLSKESTYLRKKEDEIFNTMSAEVSGRNAATIVRGKKVKDVEEEAAKAKRDQEMKEKYDRWGKGLKQVEDRDKRIEEQLHEMSKPLARYADDEDLEKYLKEQEREGDPMLAYIRKKKKKEKVAAGIPEKPMYMGEFMPNRFGIRPGYRWDGVDRSNGYEKKWFTVQNEKRANREEAFKWSTEDM